MTYLAPVEDMSFVLEHLVGMQAMTRLPGLADATPGLALAVLEESARLNSDVVSPLNAVGDKHPSRWENGSVIAPPGFRQAYRLYAEGGWQGASHPSEYGGQELPRVISAPCMEMLQPANLSFGLCPLLADGAIEALLTAASDELKKRYLPSWSATRLLPRANAHAAAIRAPEAIDAALALDPSRF